MRLFSESLQEGSSPSTPEHCPLLVLSLEVNRNESGEGANLWSERCILGVWSKDDVRLRRAIVGEKMALGCSVSGKQVFLSSRLSHAWTSANVPTHAQTYLNNMYLCSLHWQLFLIA